MKALKAKKQILRSQISNARSRNNERQLERELQHFFDRLGKQVQQNLNDYWSDHLLQGQIDLITKPILEAQAEYYLILQKYDKREYQLGIREAERLVRLSKKPIAEKAIFPRLRRTRDLFATLRGAEEDLLERVFIASQATLARVDTSIKTLLTEGYQSGKGINYVANLLIKRFDQLTTWESKRIARTEIHNSHNTAVMDTYNEIGVEYTMWISADDDRTRESHLEINGEIIPIGGTYSNGLKYPGDTDGPIEEWINCRCSNAPYVIPYGYTAPPFSPFREEDLIKIK
jgi:SPP1 gp7 family putative phage head morphogenesis protein